MITCCSTVASTRRYAGLKAGREEKALCLAKCMKQNMLKALRPHHTLDYVQGSKPKSKLTLGEKEQEFLDALRVSNRRGLVKYYLSLEMKDIIASVVQKTY